ncbi:major tail protein [Terribacillus sp. JSM ZJ617]|uniref:major tail protein n=1 Tax=Terribacillus sp. JSM ZJ617 TaxID=3342119 RepID=UPI0035A9016A
MASVGVSNLHIAKLLTDNKDGVTYDTPKKVAPSITVGMVPTTNSNNLYGDDQVVSADTTLGPVELTLNTTDLPAGIEAEMLGHTINEDGVMVSNSQDQAPYFAVGFSSKQTDDGKELFVWLLKVKFRVPDSNHQTKGENVEYQTPTIIGSGIPRTSDGDWRYKVKSGDEGVNQSKIESWFTQVYDKSTAEAPASTQTFNTEEETTDSTI